MNVATIAAGRPVPAINGLRAANATAEEAHRLLVEQLEGFGSRLSPEHSEALRQLQYTYIHTALGMTAARTAWPLAVGAGKTESVAAFAAVACRRERRPISMMVAQNSIESLCKLKRRMIDLGVPPEMIGLVHSKGYKEEHRAACMRLEGPGHYASEPSIPEADRGRYPILLVSHQLLKTRQDVHSVNQYGDGERDLVVWDETLLKSTGRTMDLTEVQGSANLAAAFVTTEEHPEADAALRYVRYCLDELNAKLAEASTKAVRLPEKLVDEREAWSSAIAAAMPSRKDDCATLTAFIEMTQEPLRVVPLKRGAAISSELLIPDSLKRVVILDASYNIRELVKTYDKTINVIDGYTNSKSFEAVTAAKLNVGGGRTTINAMIRQKDSSLLKAIVERVTAYPDDEGVCLFTYKSKPWERKLASHAEIIKAGLRRAEIDTEAMLPNGKSRFVWLTWGQELGLSDFAYCERVMLVSIYRKSHEQYAMSIAGQLGNLEAPEAGDHQAIRGVEISEVFHALYQAMGRGSCRITENGKARPMHLDFICVEPFPVEYWDEATPGIELTEWTSKHLEPSRVAKPVADIIAKYLEGLPETAQSVSSRALGRHVAGVIGRKINGRTMARARKLALESIEGWRYSSNKQAWYRCPF